MSKLTAEQIIEDIKSNCSGLNFDIKYQGNIPAEVDVLYNNSHIFDLSLFDKTISFNNLYQNYVYQKYIKSTILTSEKFMIESEGVRFDYNLHKSLITKLIPKIVLGFKKYYINNKEYELNEDFKCHI